LNARIARAAHEIAPTIDRVSEPLRKPWAAAMTAGRSFQRFGDDVVVVQPFAERRMRLDLGVADSEIRIGRIVTHAVFLRTALHRRHEVEGWGGVIKAARIELP
jgi:hypothetical protein